MDNRRTMERVFAAWLYRESLTPEERLRLMHCAKEIRDDAARGWPNHQMEDNS